MSETKEFLVDEKMIATAYQLAMIHGSDGDILGVMSRYLIRALASRIQNIEGLSEEWWSED